MLEARHLQKTYGDRTVVADFSLTVKAGEIVGLLGPNGAGKSTTVGMLCGLVEPDQGDVFLGDGNQQLALSEHAMAVKSRIGVVPQDLSIYENLAAKANLELFGALYGLKGALLQERVNAALQLVGLADRAKDKPSTFSGGMKRRLNIAAALVHDPDVLIFDEPTVGIDPQSRNAIFDNLEALRARGKALLYTTHYMEEAERLCDRVLIIDHGRVVASDSVAGLARLLPATQQLEIVVDGVVDLAAIGALPHVSALSQHDGTLKATVEELGRDGSTLLAALASRGHHVSGVSSARAGLEDVFLSLTGRALRD